MNIKNDIVVDSKKTANTDAFKKDETSLTTVKKYSTPSIEDRISKFNDVRVTKGKDDSENKLKHVQKLPLLTIKNGKGVQDTSDNNLWDIVERSPTVKNNASVNIDSTSNGTEVIEKDEQNLDNAEQRMLEAAAKADIQYMESSLSSDSTLYNIHDDRGNTILHIVCKFGHMDCLQWLVKNTLCRELVLLDNDDVQTPAIVAVKHGKLECLQWLVLETGVKKQLTNEVNQPVLLHQAARFGQEQCLRWLLGYMQMQDLSIDVTDPHGNTAAHLAAKYGHLSCLQTLVEFNADITATNKKGHTACKVAANHHHDTSAQFLIVVESCITLAEQVTGFRKELR
uniref:Synphilin-1-like n=1 Tax=Saccoglossus kowalevskii TaxID=10224 RepID=A0ABM0M380_SACKO